MKSIKLPLLQADPRSANYMSPERREKLKANYRYHKRFPAIIVRPHPDQSDEYIIIDGHQRVVVALEMGLKTLPCEVWDVEDTQAGLLLATLNQLRGEDLPKKRAELIEGLLESFSKDQLTTLIPESSDEIDALVGLLAREEEEFMSRFKEALEKEAELLPIILNFVFSKSDADFVINTLKARNSEDQNQALMAICQEVSQRDEEE